MFTFLDEHENVHGDPIMLIHKQIGPGSEGSQFIVSFKPQLNNRTKFFITLMSVLTACLATLYYLECIEAFYFIGCGSIVILIALIKAWAVKKEKVIVIPSVGLQYSTEYFYGNQSCCFIHWQNLVDIVINEVIHRNKIIYVLTVIVNDKCAESYVRPLFLNTKPRLKCLEVIYREMQNILQRDEQPQSVYCY